MADHLQLAERLLHALGGAGNVKEVTHCMTRLRVETHDLEKIDEKAIAENPEVLGVVKDERYQIVLGPKKAQRVAEEIQALLEGEREGGAVGIFTNRHDTATSRFLRRIGNIFIPLILPLIGAGLITGLAGILKNILAVSEGGAFLSALASVVSVIGAAFLAFLTIFAGVFAAKEFGGTPALGGAVAAIIVYPGVADISYSLPVIGTIVLSPGQGGMIGAVLSAVLVALLEQRIRRKVPETLDLLVTPTLALLLAGLATLFVLMPVAGKLSELIGEMTVSMLVQGGVMAGFVLAATFLPFVMLGLHQALIPLHFELISQYGSTPLFPILAMAGAGQVGAVIAVYVKLKHNDGIRRRIRGILPVGLLGIGEPLIYGVSLPLGRPFVTACLGGGVGGAFIGFFAMQGNQIGSLAIGPSGLTLIPLVTGPLGSYTSALFYITGLLIAYVAGFILTYLFGFTKAMLSVHNTQEDDTWHSGT